MRTVLRFLVPVVALAVGGAAVSLSGGCGSNAPAPTAAAVRGKVLLNGQPVAGGLVVFTPSSERGGHGKPVVAETGPDGSYTLQHERAYAIPPGWYRVSLAPPPQMSAGQGGTFPAKLARPDLSGIEREVKAGKEHVFEFAVDVPKE